MNRALAFTLLAGLALAPLAGLAQVPDARIGEMLAEIRSEPEGTLRGQFTARLAEYVAAQRNGATRLEARTIDDIAGLLADEDDWVRFYAAASLGFVGPGARRALPQLERALDRARGVATLGPGSPGVFAGLSSANAICTAIGKIDLGRKPAGCENFR